MVLRPSTRLFPPIYAAARLVALVLLAAALAGRAAAAFSPDALQSVVSVLPDWPAKPKGAAPVEGAPKHPEGSGVAVLPGGYIATNVHVLGRAERVTVRLEDGRQLPARILGRDAPTDIALLQIDADLPVLRMGGEPPLASRVCAVGNQFGLGLSVTCGVVSALRRTGTGFNPIEDFIQTDAPINPGGSGGALFDSEGRLVGLVSAIFTKESDANIGINFAASSRLVMRVVDDLKAHGRVLRGRPGFVVEPLAEDARETQAGVRVSRIEPGNAAATAGIKVGDVVTTIAGRRIRKTADVASAIGLHRPGDRFEIAVVRDGVPVKSTFEVQP